MDGRPCRAERRVRNVASGALDADQTVTFEEMLEHSFYQMLNLAQILYLHSCCAPSSVGRCQAE